MQYASLDNTSALVELDANEIDEVNGGLYRILGSIVGGLLYDLAKHVAENGGPPPPNLGFH